MTKYKIKIIKLILIPFVSTFCILAGLINSSSVLASPPKIALSPNPLSLNIGSSQVVTVTLNEPIICENPYLPCNLGLIFTSSDPTNTTMTPSSLSFSSSSWYVPQQITVTSLNNGQYGDENVTISSTAVSGSEYYSGFQVSLSTIIHNTNEPTAPVVNQAANTTNSPSIGSSQSSPLAPDTGYGVSTNNEFNMKLTYCLTIMGLLCLAAGTKQLLRSYP